MEGVALGAHGTYIVNAAATVGPAGVSVVIGCVSSAPVRATVMEERLAAGDLSEGAVRAAAAGLAESLDPPSDVHASADYRSHLAEVSAVRAVLKAANRGQRHHVRPRRPGLAAARPLPPRRPRSHRHPHRLRHR
jgi:xanthine dehydrogenase iron-sulfur cluster and FAD-binding subunit A